MSFTGLGGRWDEGAGGFRIDSVWTRQLERVRVHVTPDGIRRERGTLHLYVRGRDLPTFTQDLTRLGYPLG